MNEAAILAARQGKSGISFQDMEEAVDRVIAGPARRSRQVSEKEREIVAYHEAGHALAPASLPDADPVHKLTIMARGAAGGYTRLLPDEEPGSLVQMPVPGHVGGDDGSTDRGRDGIWRYNYRRVG